MTLDRILDDYGVTIVPTAKRRSAGETHAGGVLRQIHREHGAEHLCSVLALLRGSARNRECLNSETLASVSDVLLTRPDWPQDFAVLVDAFEAVDLAALRDEAIRLRPWPIKATLRVWLYAELQDRLGAVAHVEMAA